MHIILFGPVGQFQSPFMPSSPSLLSSMGSIFSQRYIIYLNQLENVLSLFKANDISTPLSDISVLFGTEISLFDKIVTPNSNISVQIEGVEISTLLFNC